MKNEIQRYLDLLERRHAVLSTLAERLQESRQAFVGLNLDAIQQYTTEQETLCAEIQFLDREMGEAKEKLAAEFHLGGRMMDFDSLARQLDTDTARRLRLLLKGLESIQADVRRLNRVQTELLRRSRRSINVLMNFVANCKGTYQPPPRTSGYSPPAQIPLGGVGHV